MNIDAQREHDAKTGGSVFPMTFTVDGEQVCVEGSLTLRDYFAAHAPEPETILDIPGRCEFRYRYADAMLAARSK